MEARRPHPQPQPSPPQTADPDPDPGRIGHRTLLAWAALIVGALALRWPGLSPAVAAWHPDEYNFVAWPLLILLGEAVPPVFYYPHLSYYGLALANALDLLLSGAAGAWDAALLQRLFWHPADALGVARALGVLCAVATVPAAGWLARRAGVCAGWTMALMAVCAIHVRQSPVAGADVPMTLAFTLAVAAAVRVRQRQGRLDYALAGALVGLAAALKYQGALAAVALPVVHLACRRRLDRRLLLAGGAAGLLFLACSPGVLLDAGTFGSGFTQLWHHVAPGQVADTPGWWRHLSVSLLHAWGPAGLLLLAAGLALLARRRDPAGLAVVAAFLLYFAVAGSARLTFVRYALPLTPLAAVAIAAAISRAGRWAPLVALLVLAPGLYASARIGALRWHPDTRVQAAGWMARHLPEGAVVCNFGGWAGDPPARTVEDVWWKISQLVRSAQTPTVAAALGALDDAPPPVPFVSYLVQTGNQDLAPGAPGTVRDGGCDCVVAHRHALHFSSVTPGLDEQLTGTLRHAVTFDPGDGTAAYDEQDALYVPLAGFGDLRRAGPRVDIWVRPGLPPTASWDTRDLFARALVRGAGSLASTGEHEPALHLVQQALSLVPRSRDPRLFEEAGRVFGQLGLAEAQRASRERAAALAR